MNEIIVVVKPVSEVINDGAFDPRDTMFEKVSVEYCYNCGSSLMYIREEKDIEGKVGVTDYTWYCAVCGSCQSGVMVPSGETE